MSNITINDSYLPARISIKDLEYNTVYYSLGNGLPYILTSLDGKKFVMCLTATESLTEVEPSPGVFSTAKFIRCHSVNINVYGNE